MDTFNEPVTDSETIGMPSPASEGESSTGPRPGEIGFGRMPNEHKDLEPLEPGTARWDSLMEAIGAREAERKAEVRSAIAEKRWFRASLTQLLNGEGRPPEILMERATGYTGGWLPPSVSEAQGAATVEELALARQAVEPAGPEATGLILAKLALVLILPDGNNHKLMMATYLEDLEDVPADVLDNACRKWRRRQKFWPTIAELLELCEPEARERRSRLWRLAELDSVRRNPAPGCIVTADWHWARMQDGKAAYDAALRAPAVGEAVRPQSPGNEQQ